MAGLFFGVAAFYDVQDLIRHYYGVRLTRAGQSATMHRTRSQSWLPCPSGINMEQANLESQRIS
jgi:hypothetical protein